MQNVVGLRFFALHPPSKDQSLERAFGRVHNRAMTIDDIVSSKIISRMK